MLTIKTTPGKPVPVARELLRRLYGRVHCSEFCSTWHPVYVTAESARSPPKRSKRSLRGRVIAQKPSGGALRPRNFRVKLTVGKR